MCVFFVGRRSYLRWGSCVLEEIHNIADIWGGISASVSGRGECADTTIYLTGEYKIDHKNDASREQKGHLGVFPGEDGSSS